MTALKIRIKNLELRIKRRGFTLIELLVAISIVAVISAIGYVNYSSAQSTARDAKRKQDLNAIKVALQLYYQANNRYPCSGSPAWEKSTTTTTNWIKDQTVSGNPNCGGKDLDSNYINQTPIDPKANGGNPTSVPGTTGYVYWGADTHAANSNCPQGEGQYYIIVALLENKYDADSYYNKTQQGTKKTIFCGGKAAFTYDDAAYVVATDI